MHPLPNPPAPLLAFVCTISCQHAYDSQQCDKWYLEEGGRDLCAVQPEVLGSAEQLRVSGTHAEVEPERLERARQPICSRRADRPEPLCRHLLQSLRLERRQPLLLLLHAVLISKSIVILSSMLRIAAGPCVMQSIH